MSPFRALVATTGMAAAPLPPFLPAAAESGPDFTPLFFCHRKYARRASKMRTESQSQRRREARGFLLGTAFEGGGATCSSAEVDGAFGWFIKSKVSPLSLWR